MNVANNYFPHKIIAFSSVSHSGFMVVKLNKLNLLQIPIWSKSRGRIEIPKAPLLGGNKDLIAQVHTAPCAEHITFYFLLLFRSFIPNRRAAEAKKILRSFKERSECKVESIPACGKVSEHRLSYQIIDGRLA